MAEKKVWKNLGTNQISASLIWIAETLIEAPDRVALDALVSIRQREHYLCTLERVKTDQSEIMFASDSIIDSRFSQCGNGQLDRRK